MVALASAISRRPPAGPPRPSSAAPAESTAATAAAHQDAGIQPVHLILNLLPRFRVCVPLISRLPAICAAAFWPASDFASPKCRSIATDTVPPAIFCGSIATFMPFASLERTRRSSILAGVGSKLSALRYRLLPLKSLNSGRQFRRGRHLPRGPALGVGNELAHRAVGLVEVSLGHAHHVLRRDLL